MRGLAIFLLAGTAALWFSGKIELTLLVLGGLLALVMAFADLAILPALAIALIVVGGIYGGVFTPTEGAAVGTIAMLAAG